jgi:hypothetical protein
VAGPVGERGGRRDDAVAVRPQARKLRGQLARDPLDAADLAARGRPAVDYDRPALIGSSAFRQRARGIGWRSATTRS